MKIYEVGTGVLAMIEMEKQADLANSFMRVQEFYESPKFRDELFTRYMFEKWYKKSRKAKTFTYAKDWSGFNVPGYVVRSFLLRINGPETELEEKLFDKLAQLVEDHGVCFYVIGVVKGDYGAVTHELCHAMYRLVPTYTREVNYLLERNPPLVNACKKALTKIGYGSNVLLDEMHAWTAVDTDSLVKMVPARFETELRELALELRSFIKRVDLPTKTKKLLKF